MTVWDNYSKTEKKDYEYYLSIYGALTALFNQKSSVTGAPYLDSKFQETVFARSFKQEQSQDVDIGNTPHDIRSIINGKNIGIGLKTWLSSNPSYQKVMQIKSYRNDIQPLQKNPTALAFKIAEIKNSRLLSDYNRLGLEQNCNIYHYVTRDSGKMTLFETSYPLIDTKHLIPGKLTSKSFEFSDENKQYKYTFGDSQIWMRFDPKDENTEELDVLNVKILNDPFTFLKTAFKNTGGIFTIAHNKPKRDYIYLPLYSYKMKDVPERSGLNAWNGLPKTHGSTRPRPKGEAYIPIPKVLWQKCPYWVDTNVDMSDYESYKQKTGKSSYPIKLHLPNNTILTNARFGQGGFKCLETKPQSELGTWILSALGITNPQRTLYNVPAQNIVTKKLLQDHGIDSVKLWHEDPNKPNEIWIDFAEYGSFERFMNNQPQFENIDDSTDEYTN